MDLWIELASHNISFGSNQVWPKCAAWPRQQREAEERRAKANAAKVAKVPWFLLEKNPDCDKCYFGRKIWQIWGYA